MSTEKGLSALVHDVLAEFENISSCAQELAVALSQYKSWGDMAKEELSLSVRDIARAHKYLGTAIRLATKAFDE